MTSLQSAPDGSAAEANHSVTWTITQDVAVGECHSDIQFRIWPIRKPLIASIALCQAPGRSCIHVWRARPIADLRHEASALHWGRPATHRDDTSPEWLRSTAVP
jgi:hypothetical protein